MPSATPADFAPPHGTFLVGFDDDGRAGLRAAASSASTATRRDQAHVRRAGRARSRARAGLLGALEDAARGLGYGTVRLDTGPHQPHAQALYESAGYRAIGNFNANPFAAFWGEKRLAR